MSPILLDTHAAVWAATGTLSARAARATDAASENGQLMLSPISAWEIGTLVEKGRLRLAVTAEQFVRAMFDNRSVVVATLTPAIAVSATTLRGLSPSDPADRILIATASAYGAHLMTRDAAIHKYARATRYIRALSC